MFCVPHAVARVGPSAPPQLCPSDEQPENQIQKQFCRFDSGKRFVAEMNSPIFYLRYPAACRLLSANMTKEGEAFRSGRRFAPAPCKRSRNAVDLAHRIQASNIETIRGLD